MNSITKIIERELKLKVNRDKSAVDIASKRKFLGFSFYFVKGGIKTINYLLLDCYLYL